MKQSDSDIVCDFFTWHAGGGSYVLTDEYNNVSLEKKKHYICYFHYPKITQWFQNLTVLNSWFLIFICYVFIFSTFFVFEDFMISIWEVYQMICVYLMGFLILFPGKGFPQNDHHKLGTWGELILLCVVWIPAYRILLISTTFHEHFVRN